MVFLPNYKFLFRRILIVYPYIPICNGSSIPEVNWLIQMTNCRECCQSTSARLVDNCSLSRRTYKARCQQTENSRLKNLVKHIVQYFFINCREMIGSNWYQPCAHTCNSCKRLVTYRSIRCTSYKKHVFYTCTSGELIQIETEQLRSKRIIIYLHFFITIFSFGAIFIAFLNIYFITSLFQLTCAVI